ncbi:MAG: hypothetical protein GVY11_07325 [Gammaproteobacteria bacterium]|jgi:hypothetical protein|nr:hypothetical protein [Gammaproteobacteria bacterium]
MSFLVYFLVLNAVGLLLGSVMLELAGRRFSRTYPELEIDEARSAWFNGLALGFAVALGIYWLVYLTT